MHVRMNWTAVAFDWNQARAFLAVCEQGSLTGAAKVLKQTQPTVGRQISALEEALSVTLFERVGHKLVLTEIGHDLQSHVQDMANAATRLSIVANRQSQDMEGQVRITASDLFAAHILPPVLKELRKSAPGLEIDVVATNSISDLLAREADIALRHIRPQEPDLIARLVHDAKADFYGAKDYIARMGTPHTVDDLQRFDFISFGDVSEMIMHLEQIGLSLTPAHFPINSANGLVAWEYVRQGLGISVMSRDVGQRTPDVVRLLPDLSPVQFPVWLVSHRELHTAKRIRFVYDALAQALPQMMA